jgi:hypothetical protein
MKGIWALALFVAAAALLERPALAARAGTVDEDQAELYEGPGKKYKVLEKVSKGTSIAASNFPTEGFYKVKTASGSTGWMSADALVLGPPPPDDSGNVPTAAPTDQPGMPVGAPPSFRTAKAKKRVRLRALFGGDFFSVTDVNTLLGFDGLKYGYSYGGEVHFIFTNDLALVVRVERILKSVVGVDSNTLKSFQLNLGSTPAMIGLSLTLTSEGKLSTHFAVLGGLGIQTELDAIDLSDPGPNVTSMAAHAFTGLVKLDANYALTKAISVFGEGGYRVLQTIPIEPGTPVNGSQIFQQNGAYVPVTLNLSGPVLGVGLEYTF